MTQISPGYWGGMDARIVAALKPSAAPIGISFKGNDDVPSLGRPMAPANNNGRTGAVPAGCVFWMMATDRTFSTSAADHANCSVGSYTHGLITAETAAGRDDVGAILEAGWVDEESFMGLPRLGFLPARIDYGPLSSATNPDVILLRINGLALMTLKDAFVDLAIEGKPQCHIIPFAFNEQRPVASTGCALSRARTGMRSEEMTCALPAARADELLERLEATVQLDRAMARYAADDAKRWSA
jgi:uncharacterized protein (DUF169 family)